MISVCKYVFHSTDTQRTLTASTQPQKLIEGAVTDCHSIYTVSRVFSPIPIQLGHATISWLTQICTPTGWLKSIGYTYIYDQKYVQWFLSVLLSKHDENWNDVNWRLSVWLFDRVYYINAPISDPSFFRAHMYSVWVRRSDVMIAIIIVLWMWMSTERTSGWREKLFMLHFDWQHSNIVIILLLSGQAFVLREANELTSHFPKKKKNSN
jgi:hypothetical protein